MKCARARTLSWLGAAFAAGSAILGCSKGNHDAPGMDNGTDPHVQMDASLTDPCTTPGHFGCPCEEKSAVVECGKVVEKSGDYVTCSMGRSTCDGHTWGPCSGDHVVIKSLPGLAFGGSGLQPLATSIPCTNVCDPNACSSVSNTGSDIADAAGLKITEAGVSLLPTEASTGSGPCKGLWCQIVTCDAGKKTSLSGIVYDPAGKNPLYNAFVYIPVDPTVPLPAFTSGATCDTCSGANLSAIAVAQTGADGKFKLDNVPAGAGIPLVVQMGKWRRKIILPTVTACADNAVAKDNARLPKNRFDGDGNAADIPKMAIASGDADPFECLLLKAGIDASEIQFPSAGARIDYKFNGVDRLPGGAPAGSTLTSSLTTLKKYDAVLLPCEGFENNAHNSDAANLVSYTDVGGRIFATHYGYQWLATPISKVAKNSTAFYGTATWKLDTQDYYDPMTSNIDQSFPKGAAFAQWMINVGASATLGKLTINEPRHDAKSAISPPSQRWMYGNSSVNSTTTPDMLLSMTFNTPVAASSANQCGRVVFSDFHVSADALVSGSGACTTDNDCGVTSLCSPPVVGVCSDQSCVDKTDCDLASSTCSLAVKGACKPALCATTSDCPKGSCVLGHCTCTKDKHCGSNDCNSSVCAASSCYSNSDCGGSEYCLGGVTGTCSKTCTKDTDCGGSTRCVAGLCKGCITDSDCPGSSTTCTGGKAASCSSIGSLFPLTCRNGDLSAQEKALEFMLFDLTACVSPDSFTPPAPSIQYNPVTFSQDYTAVCAKGKHVAWREFDWQDQIPDTSSIVFSAQTADTVTGLGTAQSVPMATMTTSTAVPSWDVAILDAKSGGAFKSVSPAVTSQNMLRVTITLNPTSDKKASPLLMQWKVQYDCLDAE